VSHSGDYCVLAAGKNLSKLGVDTMKVEHSGGLEKLDNFFRVMEKQFSISEWKYIRSVDSESSDDPRHQKLERFMRLWSLKESFVKAEGTGIILPLSKISFVCDTLLNNPKQDSVCDSQVFLSGTKLEEWNFQESMLDSKHYASIAMVQNTNNAPKEEDTERRFKILKIVDLLEGFNREDIQFTAEDELFWSDFCKKK